MSAWLGMRNLTDKDGQRVEVAIGAPYVEEEVHWYCDVRFTVGGHERLERVGGVDAFQALQLAFFLAWRDTEAMGAKWDILATDSGFLRPLLTSEPSHFDIPKLHAMIDAELARQEKEAADFYAARERAHAEGHTPPPWPPRMKAWRDALEAARVQEKRERQQAIERDAESPEARGLFASATDAIEAIANGMKCLWAIANDSAGTSEDVSRLIRALSAVKSGRYRIDDYPIDDELLDQLDRLKGLTASNARWKANSISQEFAKTKATRLLDTLMTMWTRGGLRI